MTTWPTKKLGEITPFLRGSGLSKKDLTSSGTYKCILYGQLYTMYGPVIDEVKSRTDKKSSMFSVAGDVLVPGTTTADEIGIAVASALNETGVVLGGDINIIRTENKLLNSKFLAYLLSGPFKMRLAKYARGTNIIHLSGKDIAKIEIPVPPMRIQKEIVERLDKIVAAQKLNNELIQKADELFQSLLHKELDPADKNWRMTKFGEDNFMEIIDGDRGKNYPSKSEFKKYGYCVFLNTKNVTTKGFVFEEVDFISRERDEKLRKGKLKRNDIVLTTRGTVGNCALYDDSISFDQMRINSGMVILRVNIQKIIPTFLLNIVSSNLVQRQFKQILSGTAQPQLPIGNLIKVKFFLPPLEAQKRIATKLSAVQDYKTQLLAQKSKLKELFDSALSKSMKNEP